MPLSVDNLLLLSSVDDLMRKHPTASLLVAWAVGMLSYHQDAKTHDWRFGTLSQILAAASLIALVVFGFTQRDWANLLIAPALVYAHIQFTRRWWARPGRWW